MDEYMITLLNYCQVGVGESIDFRCVDIGQDRHKHFIIIAIIAIDVIIVINNIIFIAHNTIFIIPTTPPDQLGPFSGKFHFAGKHTRTCIGGRFDSEVKLFLLPSLLLLPHLLLLLDLKLNNAKEPKCVGLNQAFEYSPLTPPTILFRQ